MIYGERKSCLIDIDRTPTEFTGDDVDRYSSLVSLDKPYDFLLIEIPTIDTATVGIYVQPDDAIATVPKALHVWKLDNTSAALTTSSGTGALTIRVPLTFVQFFRLYTSANQLADRTFYVRGVRS